MSTPSGKQIVLTTAVAGFLMLFAFQGSVAAARLAGNAQPVSTASTEPVKDGVVVQKVADTEDTPAPAPKRHVRWWALPLLALMRAP